MVLGNADAPETAGQPWKPQSVITMPWSRLRKQARNGSITARLVDQDGLVHMSGVVPLRDADMAERKARRGLLVTQRARKDSKRLCEPYSYDIVVAAAKQHSVAWLLGS